MDLDPLSISVTQGLPKTSAKSFRPAKTAARIHDRNEAPKKSGTMIRNRKAKNHRYTRVTETYAVEWSVSRADSAQIRQVNAAVTQFEDSKRVDQGIWKIVKAVGTVVFFELLPQYGNLRPLRMDRTWVCE